MTDTAPAPGTARPPVRALVLSGLLSLVVGYVVLRLVTGGIVLVWETIPRALGSDPAWYVLGVLLLAAVLVYLVRTRLGDTGHSPLAGIEVASLTPRAYLAAILAIVASLFGGAVLGPEVALVATGAVIGGIVARRLHVADATKVVGVGSVGALLALFVGPLLAGTLTLDGAPTAVEVDQLAWAIAVAVLTTVVVALSRLGGSWVARAAGPRPHLGVLVAAGAVIGIASVAFAARTGESVLYVATSGEESITELVTLTSVSTVVLVVILKSLAYAVSLGAGFRGGPFFPVIFIGAAVGLGMSLVLPDGPGLEPAAIVGVVAAVVATAPMRWRTTVFLGAVIGFAMGGWAMVPAAVIGAAVSRAVPRWGDRVAPIEHSA